VTEIKVSGLTEPGDAALAAELGADVVACVFWAPSPRYVSVPQAWEIRSALPPSVRFGGIFLDTPLPLVQHIGAQLKLDMIQLFGDESRDVVDAAGPKAYKAVTVVDSDQTQTAVRLFSGRRQLSEGVPAFMLHLSGEIEVDWPVATEPAAKAPLLLASDRLDSSAAAAAIQAARPWGIDVWETVESEPGRLDPDKLAALVSAVRATDSELGEGE
jgi:phosphoribosylanthranilate isomerase